MDLNYPEEWYSKSSSEENNDGDMGIGRSYECIFCKRGFTTAQALGGHMNIHRKERANKSKPTFSSSPPSSSSNKVVDHGIINCNYPDLTRFYSQILPTTPDHAFFPAPAQSVRPSSHGHQVFFVENQRDHKHHVFAQDWRKTSLSLYTNPLCFHEIKDKFEKSEENGLDLELRLGHHHP